jgi:hypothetical protein
MVSPEGMRPMASRTIVGKMVQDRLTPTSLERGVDVLLILAVVNLVTVFIRGGYHLSLGPVLQKAHHIGNPLPLLLACGMAKGRLRGMNAGVSIATKLRSSLLLFLGIVFIYSLPGRSPVAADNVPAGYLPLSILREFKLDLDEFRFLYEPEVPYFLQARNGHIVSTYPPWAAVVALPVYLLPTLGGLSPQSSRLLELEKLAATLMTALSVLILLFTLRRVTREKIAWLIALVYAFGTSSFSESSQSLGQHGSSQLFLALTIYCLVRGRDEPRFAAYGGCVLASAIVARPLNLLLALPIGPYILHRGRDQLIAFILAMLPPLALVMVYNDYYFGSPLTTGIASASVSPSSFVTTFSVGFSTPLLEGLLGILVSPGRGLLIYSPILLFSFVGIAMVWRHADQILLKYLSLGPFLFIMLVAKWKMWWGGFTYGPRLLADLTPILCLYLYAPLELSQGKAFLRYTFVGLAILSVGLHALGFFSDGSWNVNPTSVDRHPERLWSWIDSPPVYYGSKVFTKVR